MPWEKVKHRGQAVLALLSIPAAAGVLYLTMTGSVVTWLDRHFFSEAQATYHIEQSENRWQEATKLIRVVCYRTAQTHEQRKECEEQ